MKLISLTICVICLSVSASAQTATGSWTLGPNWTYNRSMSNLELARIAMRGEINKRLLNGSKSTRTAKKRIFGSGPTSYSTGKGYLLPGLISEQAEGTAAEKAQVKSALEQSLRFYDNIALQKEYPANDLSFALLYYLINSYVVYRNIDPAATDVSGQTQYLVGGFYSPLYTHEKALYNQLKTQLTSNTGIRGMSGEEKQKAAELLAIYTTLMWHQFQDFKQRRDMKGLGMMRSRAAANVEGFVGTTIDKIDINDRGIVLVK